MRKVQITVNPEILLLGIVAGITYLGIDETTLGIGSDSTLVVAAQTSNSALRRDMGYRSLRKARDYLEANLALPSPDEMKDLEMFHWTRVKGGRFPKPILEHAGIAHLVRSNGYKPESTVLLIDRFHARDSESHFLIKEYLHAQDFRISEKNIEIIGGADQRIPITNYADLIAFQIGLQLSERYRRFHPQSKRFMQEPYLVPFDARRSISLSTASRDMFQRILEKYRGKVAA